ncbi:unnamed protein product [Schistosoma margrebowiei]|uniref:Uncharacterized protein n=1 Tax=Schistosoma margrebowiei TaxID=48269 RepID=A0A183LD58_9TREM|nr:unnamed protein product [Schistosoma margrebowiei]
MSNNSRKRGISPTFKPNKRSKSVTPTTDDSVLDNVEPLTTEKYVYCTQMSLSSLDSLCRSPSISTCSMPTVRLVYIQDTIPKCIEKSAQSTRQYVLPRPKSKISKTKESNGPPHTHQNTDRHSNDIRQLQNSLSKINSKLEQLAPLTHIWDLDTDRNLEQLTKAECILEFVAEEVTKRVMSSFNAVVYNLPDRTHPSKLKDICLRACGMPNVNCKVIRLRKKSDKSTCPLLFMFGCCNNAKQFIDLSKNISSLIPYKNIKVTPDLTPCQRRVRRREAIELNGSVTVSNQPETVYNTANSLKHTNNKHDTTPHTADHSFDLDESTDQKPLDKIRTPTDTKNHNDMTNSSCSFSNVLKCESCNNTRATKPIHLKICPPKDIPQVDLNEQPIPVTPCEITNVEFSVQNISKAISTLKHSYTDGPDGIPSSMLKRGGDDIYSVFQLWALIEAVFILTTKYTHTKYVMSVCKKNSDDPTLKYFFVRYVCTYGRKRSSSESDACVQDVDDNSNNHSSEEHTTSNSPTQPRQRRRRRSSTYALLQMNLSFRSKYCHCQPGFWVRAVNASVSSWPQPGGDLKLCQLLS